MKLPKLELGFSFDFKENRDVIIMIISLVLSACFIYLVVGDSYREYLIAEENIKSKEESLILRKKLLVDINDIENSEEEVKSRFDKIKNFVPNRNNYEDFGAHINTIAGDSGVSINNFTISESDESEYRFNKGAISLSFAGDLLSVENFLKTLENSIPFVKEESFSVSVGSLSDEEESYGEGETDFSPILNCQIELSYIYS